MTDSIRDTTISLVCGPYSLQIAAIIQDLTHPTYDLRAIRACSADFANNPPLATFLLHTREIPRELADDLRISFISSRFARGESSTVIREAWMNFCKLCTLLHNLDIPCTSARQPSIAKSAPAPMSAPVPAPTTTDERPVIPSEFIAKLGVFDDFERRWLAQMEAYIAAEEASTAIDKPMEPLDPIMIARQPPPVPITKQGFDKLHQRAFISDLIARADAGQEPSTTEIADLTSRECSHPKQCAEESERMDLACADCGCK